MAQLSTHFSLEELTTTQHRRLSNAPTQEHLSNLTITSQKMELVRHILGDRSLHINSAYRSEAINKAVGGSKTSAHCQGWAVDFICPGFGTPLEVAKAIAASEIKFDQLIYEGTWVHISFDPKMRQQIMTAHFVPGRATTYTVGI